MKVKLVKLKNLPKGYKPEYVKVIRAGNVKEFTEMRKAPPTSIDCLRVSKDNYIKPSEIGTEDAGTVYEYNHSANKSDLECIESVRRTLANIRQIINANCTEPEKLHWITLTYAENMTDTKRLYKDFRDFWKRFKRWCVKQGYEPPEYITVVEPQGRGAWHCHCIFIWKQKRPFIDNNSVFAKLWGHGFTKIKAVKADCDNIGAYFSAYLADMPLDEFQKSGMIETLKQSVQVEQKQDETGKSKKYVKGARLRLYPVGMNIYRTSRGIKKPEVEKLTPQQAKKEKASSGKLTFSTVVGVVTDDSVANGSGVCNSQIIYKAYYNTKRK